eukprot:m.678546 g.678546  ORF g.678546 m.678546 type:complete len:522 (+) comp22804_c3_seq1:230-1795(+)
MTMIIIGAAVAGVAFVILLVLAARWMKCCCCRPRPLLMSEQIAAPVKINSRRKFEYRNYREENRRPQSMRETNNGQEIVIDFHLGGDRDAEAAAADGAPRGYLEVEAQGTPSKSTDRISAAVAFSPFELGSSSTLYRLPSETDGDEMLGFTRTDSVGSASDMLHRQPSRLGSVSRRNPTFDEATMSAVFEHVDFGDEGMMEIGGSDHESELSDSEYLGFDVDVDGDTGAFVGGGAFGFDRNDSDSPVRNSFGGVGDEEHGGYGFGGADTTVPPLVPAEVSRDMEAALDLLNLQTSIEERVEGIERTTAVLRKYSDTGVQELIDMNGVVSLATVIKEETDAQIQMKALVALNLVCAHENGATEAIQNHIVNVWAMVLTARSPQLWQEAVEGLALVRSNRMAVMLMLSEGVLPRLCQHIHTAAPQHRVLILEVIVAIARHAERISNLTGLYETLAVCLKRDKSILPHIVDILDAGIGAFGTDAIDLLKQSGLDVELQGLSSSLQTSSPLLTNILFALEEPVEF